jgi:hypothetical protein
MRSSSFVVCIVLLPLVALGALGCSSASSSGGQGTPEPDAQAGPVGYNPYGVPYPSDNIGSAARKGPIKGDQIQDFKFLGYPGGDTSKGLQTISLGDFYDPQGKLGYKLLHLGMAASWCVPCNQETMVTVPAVPGFTMQGVVFAQALGEGTMQGTGATPADLMAWVAKYKSNFTEMLDPEYANLGMFFDAAELPWNAIIDARSMEILTDGVGFSGNLQNDLAPWIAWVASNPPSYPAPSP